MAQKSILLAGLLAAAIGLSACQQTRVIEGQPSGGGTGGPVAARPTGIEGAWLDANGAQSTFGGGIVQTRLLATNEPLAEGTYRSVGSDTYEVQVRSRSGTQNVLNCLLASVNQLNCTNTNNQRFIYTRAGTA